MQFHKACFALVTPTIDAETFAYALQEINSVPRKLLHQQRHIERKFRANLKRELQLRKQMRESGLYPPQRLNLPA